MRREVKKEECIKAIKLIGETFSINNIDLMHGFVAMMNVCVNISLAQGIDQDKLIYDFSKMIKSLYELSINNNEEELL